MTSPGDATATCEHCHGSTTHHHAPAPGPRTVRSLSRALTVRTGVSGGLLLVVALLVTAWAGAEVPFVHATPLLLSGAGAWALVTVAALLVAGSLHRPGRPDTARRSLALGAIAAAAATPVLALAVVVLVLHPGEAAPLPADAWSAWWPAATWAGTGWLAAALTADAVGALRLRSLLRSPDGRGERARAAVAHAGRSHALPLLGAVAAAVAFTAWTVALGVLPVLVVVLVPLHASVAAFVAHARMASPEQLRRARLRG